MLKFASIVNELQFSIAQKMGYFDQVQFDLSSKKGNGIVNLVKNRVMEVDNITLSQDYEELFITVETSNGKVTKNINNAPSREQLPPFKVANVTLEADMDLGRATRFCDAVNFYNSEIVLEVAGTLNPAVFQKLQETFCITSCHFECPLDGDLLDNPQFVEIRSTSFLADYFPIPRLPQLNSKRISLRQFEPMERIDFPGLGTIVNEIFKQWFQKEREIEVFNLVTRDRYAQEGDLFSELSYSLLREFDEKTKVAIFTMDRGDKKLYISVRDSRHVTAKEYTNEEELL